MLQSSISISLRCSDQMDPFWDFYFFFPLSFLSVQQPPVGFEIPADLLWTRESRPVSKATWCGRDAGNHVSARQGSVKPTSPPSYGMSYWCCLGNNNHHNYSSTSSTSRVAVKAAEREAGEATALPERSPGKSLLSSAFFLDMLG